MADLLSCVLQSLEMGLSHLTVMTYAALKSGTMKEAIRTNGVSHRQGPLYVTSHTGACCTSETGGEPRDPVRSSSKSVLKSHFYRNAEGLTVFHVAHLFNYIYQRNEWVEADARWCNMTLD